MDFFKFHAKNLYRHLLRVDVYLKKKKKKKNTKNETFFCPRMVKAIRVITYYVTTVCWESCGPSGGGGGGGSGHGGCSNSSQKNGSFLAAVPAE